MYILFLFFLLFNLYFTICPTGHLVNKISIYYSFLVRKIVVFLGSLAEIPPA